ncbi:MAG: hypothetical protein IT469_05320 [Pseudomonadales bacterium]|nr:hypothetical protein [Pseudomonadales bacterium]
MTSISTSAPQADLLVEAAVRRPGIQHGQRVPAIGGGGAVRAELCQRGLDLALRQGRIIDHQHAAARRASRIAAKAAADGSTSRATTSASTFSTSMSSIMAPPTFAISVK